MMRLSKTRSQALPMKKEKEITRCAGKCGRVFFALLFGLLFCQGFLPFLGPALVSAQGRSADKPPFDIPEGVELYENEGHGHLEDGTRSFYKTDPPTSGPHDPTWLPPSVYKAEETRPELLVHNLEHGNVVIYFNPAVLKPSEVKWLTKLSQQYLGQWDGVLMVTRNDKAHPLILTAWRAIFRLKGLEKEKVLAFVDAFRGRGPEHPVR